VLIQINVSDAHFIVICIYIQPAENFNKFLNFLDAALKHLYKPKMEFLLCGDLNVNYLTDSNCRFCGPLINGSSDQDAQLVILTNVFTMDRVVSKAYRTHLITTDSIYILLDTLPSESRENVYEHAEVSMTLHLLLNACLSIFE